MIKLKQKKNKRDQDPELLGLLWLILGIISKLAEPTNYLYLVPFFMSGYYVYFMVKESISLTSKEKYNGS